MNCEHCGSILIEPLHIDRDRMRVLCLNTPYCGLEGYAPYTAPPEKPPTAFIRWLRGKDAKEK